MATTITGRLNKAATQFQAGDSTGFGIRLGVKYRDPKTKQDDWCNYSATIFAKSPAQIQFYQDSLIEGAIVEVSAEQLAVESYEGQNGVSLSINMLNSRLGFVGQSQPMQQNNAPQQRQPQNNQYSQQRSAPQQQTRQQPQQQNYQPNYDDNTPPF